MADINKARQEINEIDGKMAELFCRRMDAVKEVGQYKKERGLPIFNFERERQVISEGAKRIDSPDYRDYYVNFIEYVMELSKRYQSRLMDGMKIAYSGVEGAFSNIAAKKIFKNGIPLPYPDFKSAYEAVEKGECDCAVLPIENSYNGDVGQVMDLAFFGGLYIHQLREIEIVQNLIANSDATLESIKEVKSHPQALGQCGEYIHRHGFKAVEAENTAIAAQEVAGLRQDRHWPPSEVSLQPKNTVLRSSTLTLTNRVPTRPALRSFQSLKSSLQRTTTILLWFSRCETRPAPWVRP